MEKISFYEKTEKPYPYSIWVLREEEDSGDVELRLIRIETVEDLDIGKIVRIPLNKGEVLNMDHPVLKEMVKRYNPKITQSRY